VCRSKKWLVFPILFHGWRDLYRASIGFGYIISDSWTVRLAYSHYNEIIPRSQTAINLTTPFTVTNVVFANATYTLDKNEITVAYSHGFKNKIKGHNSIPAFFGGGEVNLWESFDNVAINWGYKFFKWSVPPSPMQNCTHRFLATKGGRKSVRAILHGGGRD
jgi:long-subunit fatty acid transport protein